MANRLIGNSDPELKTKGSEGIDDEVVEKLWHFDTEATSPTPSEPSSESETEQEEQKPASDDPFAALNAMPAPKEASNPDPTKGKKPSQKAKPRRRFGQDWWVKQIPLLLMIMGYSLVLIYNRYKIEDLAKEKMATEQRIMYLREHRIQMQKQYQEQIKISQIAEDLNERKIGLMSGPPYEVR